MTPPTRTPSRHQGALEPSLARVVAAFAAIYLVWGSTYLAIRFSIETLPPLLMAAVRFLVAGGALYAWARWRGAAAPTLVQWRGAAIAGCLMLTGGNGAVVIAQQWVPSGLAALLVASMPLWLVLLDSRWGARTRVTRRQATGLVVGFGGVALLAGSPGVGAGGPRELLGAGLILCGTLSWSVGSLYSRYVQAPPRPRMWVAMLMLTGGAAFTGLSLLAGEWWAFQPTGVSLKSWLALAYLVIFGALIGYGAYVWLLTVSTPARIGTYAYVNPVVALFLGGWRASLSPRDRCWPRR